MLEDEEMVARIQRDGKKGVCHLEDNLERISNGIYNEISCFEDLLTLLEYVDRDSFEADEEHLAAADEEIEAPTRIVSEKERIENLREELSEQYERLIHSEIIARRHTESDLTYEPEPPIFRILGHEDYQDRVNRLNNQVKKNK